MAASAVKTKSLLVRMSPAAFARLKDASDRHGVSLSSLLSAPWEGVPALGDAPSDIGLAERPAAPADDVASAEAAFRAFVGPVPLAEDLELSRARLLSRAENHRLIGAELARREGAPPSVTSDAEGRRLARQSERGEDFVGGLDAAREKSVAGYAREVERVEAKPLVASVMSGPAPVAFPKKDALKRPGKGK